MNYFKNNATILIINVIVSKKLMKVSLLVEKEAMVIIKAKGIIKIGSIKLYAKNSVTERITDSTLHINKAITCFLM